MATDLDGQIEAFRSRPLNEGPTSWPRGPDHEGTVKAAVIAATAINAEV